jgi:hypothetical protein
LWEAKSLLWSLYVVSMNFFGVPVFCMHESDVPLTALPHRIAHVSLVKYFNIIITLYIIPLA